MAMNMFAPAANSEMRPAALENKPAVAVREKPKSNFENFFKKINKHKPVLQDVAKTEVKKETEKSPVMNDDTIQLLSELEQQLDLMPDNEELVKQLNLVLAELGIADLSKDDLKKWQELINENRTAALSSDMEGEVKLEILSNLLSAKSEVSLDNQITANDAGKISGRIAQEPVTETLAQLLKPEIKTKSGEENRSSEDKAVVKNDQSTSNTTDIKKLIAAEANRFSGVKSQETAVSNTAIPEQTVNTADEEEVMPNISTSKSESPILKTDNKVLTMANNKPLEAKELIDQIVKKAEILLKQNISEVKIDLKPEFLGKMTIKIALEEGILTARFITENLQVKNLLESNLNTLRQSLESQGIKVEKTEVNVQLNNGGLFDGSENSWESRWERPDYSGNYQPNDQGEDFEQIPTEIAGITDDAKIAAYQPYENSSLSFLI